jgi:glutamate-1-semialdehyde 2,1-aminomutase
MGAIAPLPGFNAGLKELCAEHGALLIMDEVMTGFRVSRSGWFGLEGVAGDLYTFGKVMSGGLPAAAFGGPAALMSHLAPAGPVYQAGTLSGNPLATAAGLAVLSELDRSCYRDLAATVGRLGAGLQSALGHGVQVQVAGPLLGVFFSDAPVTDYEGASRSAGTGLYPGFMHGLLDRGVAVAPGAYEVLFTSLAHGEAELERTVEAAGEAYAAAGSGTSRDSAASAR